MWGSGLTHGLWMVVGWMLGLFAVAIAVYAGVRLASGQTMTRLIRALEGRTGEVSRQQETDCSSLKS